jgi:hypothetical protein
MTSFPTVTFSDFRKGYYKALKKRFKEDPVKFVQEGFPPCKTEDDIVKIMAMSWDIEDWDLDPFEKAFVVVGKHAVWVCYQLDCLCILNKAVDSIA